METTNAAKCMEALGNPTRLEIFRLLVRAGPGGAPVGRLQEHLGIPGSTLSHHIARLMRVGLVSQERHSRVLVCRAEYSHMNSLLAYLGEHCCQGWEASGGTDKGSTGKDGTNAGVNDGECGVACGIDTAAGIGVAPGSDSRSGSGEQAEPPLGPSRKQP